MMEYKGYTGKVEFDGEAGLFHGQVLNLRDVITFQGTSVDELRREFEASVDDYLAWCEESGEAPEKLFSGKFVVRLEPTLHRDIALRAELDGKSLNAWVQDALAQAVRPSVPAVSAPVPAYPELITVKSAAVTNISARATTEPLGLGGFEPARSTHGSFGKVQVSTLIALSRHN